jgi:DNA-binding HxlR family transcriptional regulator
MKRSSTRAQPPSSAPHAEPPIHTLFELLSRRWALRVLWELREDAGLFRQVQARCGGISPTVLNDRLRELREAGLLAHDEDDGYYCTKYGETLVRVLAPLDAWAKTWGNERRRRRETIERSRLEVSDV